MSHLHPENVRYFIDAIPNGQFFTVKFTKLNGEERVMQCQHGVGKHVKGTGQPKTDPNLITVWEPAEESYKSFRADRVISIRAQGMLLEAT